MAYAQTAYSQHTGNGPYTIAETGCFVTAFSNLLARFGEPVDPPTLNSYFNQHGTYLASPEDGAGTRDDLAWGSVSAYDGQIAVTSVGGAGWPPSNDAIVKFAYTSSRTGHTTTHFCLVNDHAAHTIVDSWDGAVKNPERISYGTPVAWATYERHIPQVVTPPAPAAAPAFTLEHIAEREEQLKVETHIWDLNQRSWPGLVNNPVGAGTVGTVFKTSAIAHHVLGGSYYLPEGSASQGFNVVDCQDAPAPPPPPAPVVITPAPVPVVPNTTPSAPLPYPTSADKYLVVTTLKGYPTANSAVNDIKATGIVQPGGYYVYNEQYDMKNVTKTKGQPGSWINPAHNIVEQPKAPEPAPAPVVVTVAPTPAPQSWQSSFQAYPKAMRFAAVRDITVKDLSGQQPDLQLKKYDGVINLTQGIVSVYGTVTKDNIDYYRLKTNNDPNFTYWYCIPKFDPITHVPLLLVIPNTPLQPVSKSQTVRDSLELVKTHIEQDALQFIDFLPKLLRNKK